MTFASNVKPIIDLPVWQYLRPLPAASAAGSCLASSDEPGADSMYLYLANNSFWRYSVPGDGWQQLANPPVGITTSNAIRKIGSYRGYKGRVLAGGASTVTLAGLNGDLVGQKIRIISGTGAGQERTISSVADPVVANSGVPTSVTAASTITDTTKAWTINQWVGYQVRIYYGTDRGRLRKILYNSATALVVQDGTLMCYDPDAMPMNAAYSSTAGAQSLYRIESHVVTVSLAWDVVPDATSRFVITGGAVFAVETNAAAPWFYAQEYDILSDCWYYRTTHTGILAAALGTDWAIERISEVSGTYDTGTATAGGAATLTDAAKTWGTNRWAGYCVRIIGGTGIGQQKDILSNTATQLTVTKPWLTAPDATSVYQIWGDVDKLWFVGSALPTMFQYSHDSMIWSQGKVYDWGAVRHMSASRTPMEQAVPISTITRVGAIATVTTGVPHPFKTGDTITIAGATGADAALYNGSFAITVASTTTFTYTMGDTPSGSAVPLTLSSTLVVDAAQNWTVNEHAGRICVLVGAGYAPANTAPFAAKITSNTATSLTLTTALGTVPTIAGMRYAITDAAGFGAEDSGTATAGSTTTLTDSGKAWVVNIWAGRWVRFTAGTGHTVCVQVTSNTATILTFATTTAPAAGTTYSLLGIPARGGGVSLDWVHSPSVEDIEGKYLISVRGAATGEIDCYDITTGLWNQNAMPLSMAETFTSGSAAAYDHGDKIYINKDATTRILRYDVVTHFVDCFDMPPVGHGAALLGDKLEIVRSLEGAKYVYLGQHTGQAFWRALIGWY